MSNNQTTESTEEEERESKGEPDFLSKSTTKRGEEDACR